MKKSCVVLFAVIMALAACGDTRPANSQLTYISIVRDHNGQVVEKSVGSMDAKVPNPAFRTAAVGCLFAQLQADNVLDPNARVEEWLPGFKTLTLREAMVNSAGPRFVSEIVEPCIEKITGKKVDDLLAERFWKPLGICSGGRDGARPSHGRDGTRPSQIQAPQASIHDVYVFFRMLADNGVAEDGARVMSRNAVKLLRRGQAPTTVNRFLSYGTRPRENGRFIGLDSTPEFDAVANPDTGECAVWYCGASEPMRPAELKEQVWKASRPLRAGVFVGVGSMGLSSTELIRYVARSPELDISFVDGEDMRNGALNSLDLLVMPGGMSGTIVGDIGPKGVENFREFVRNGGSYVGMCAGNVILLEDEYRVAYGFGMVPYSRYGSAGDAMTSMTLTDEGAKALGMGKGTFDVWYSGGPIMFRRHDEVPGAKIETWGVYASNITNEGWGAHMVGNVSCIGGTYGKGRIAATACHPEFRHSADPLAKGLFRYAAGREIAFPEPKVNKGAKKVYYYSWPVAGKECARLLVELDADPDIDIRTDERDEMCGDALDAFDALVIPDGADWSLSFDMFPPEVDAAIAAYVAKGGKVYSWGASARLHLPKGGIACCSTYEVYARLKKD